MEGNTRADDLREAILNLTMCWDYKCRKLADEDHPVPAVQAWTLIQYHLIKRKQLALLRQALADAEKLEAAT